MFDVEIEEVSPADVLDAVGELVNIVGGNLKGMLPSPTGLSLPSVTDGAVHLDPGPAPTCWSTCSCPGWTSPSVWPIWGKDGPLAFCLTTRTRAPCNLGSGCGRLRRRPTGPPATRSCRPECGGHRGYRFVTRRKFAAPVRDSA